MPHVEKMHSMKACGVRCQCCYKILRKVQGEVVGVTRKCGLKSHPKQLHVASKWFGIVMKRPQDR